MAKLLKYFLRGLVVVAPVAITIWICVAMFTTIDEWLAPWLPKMANGKPMPGAGFVITLSLITLTGFVTSTVLARSFVAALEAIFDKLPFVRLLYTSTKDMFNAFVGEQRRFDKPVLVTMSEDGIVKTIGFLTAESLSALGVEDHVTVYIPQSYGFAGNIVVLPMKNVTRIDADAADVMAYIISGGVTDVDHHHRKIP